MSTHSAMISTAGQILYQYNMVHVTRYLRKSADFHGNSLRISVKACAEIRGSSVASPRNRLSGSAESPFGTPQNCLSGTHGFVLWESSERSLGDGKLLSPRNCLRESSNHCAISFECFAATLQRDIPQVHIEVPRVPSNVSVYNLR